MEAKKEFVATFNVMEKIIALHKAHDLKLPADFHFKYGRVAMAADSIRVAYDSVNMYLTTAGRDGAFYKEALLLSLQAEEELVVPEILPEDTCEGKEERAGCWMELANHPGCFVWDAYNLSYGYSQLTVTWSGECYGAVARGEGSIVWWTEGENELMLMSGRLRQGKPHGNWVSNQNGYTEGPI